MAAILAQVMVIVTHSNFFNAVGKLSFQSNNANNLSSDNGGTGHVYKVTCGKLKKLIQPVVIQLVSCILRSDNGGNLSSGNGGTLRSDNCGTGHLFKVTSRKLKKLTQPFLIQLVGRTLRSDNDSTLR